MAQVALSSTSGCIGTTDPNIVCMGTCRSLYDTIINNCDNEVSTTYMYTKLVGLHQFWYLYRYRANTSIFGGIVIGKICNSIIILIK